MYQWDKGGTNSYLYTFDEQSSNSGKRGNKGDGGHVGQEGSTAKFNGPDPIGWIAKAEKFFVIQEIHVFR